MPELLIEFFSEEIPARMQKRAEEDLAKLLAQKLEGAGLKQEKVATFSCSRHLGAVIEKLPARAADVNEEKKGPRVGAPEQAIQGFLKSAGLASIDQAEIIQDKKSDFYVARIMREGRATADIVSAIVPEIVRAFPWPKSMRSQSSDLTWVRPLHNILCLFDGKPVPIEIEGVGNEAVTWGHRFHAPEPFSVKDAGDHYAKLRAAKVLIDREERKAIIVEQARKLCAERKLELVEDPGLLEEVAGLAEWPVVLMGAMDPGFLDLPGEVIRLSMRTHQKYFAVRDPKTGRLAPNFIIVANIDAKDGGDAIAAGNARVLSARLNDARYFWDVDRFHDPIEKTKPKKLDDDARIEKLNKIVFHQKLGSVWNKVERVAALADELCAVTGADKALVQRAARLMKCDLVTEVVGEFPELQGQIGRALAEAQGEHASVAAAIEDHYRPLGPNDRVPSDPVAVTLALADKLDTLVGFWAIDEKPTGSSDPYAFRRAALGMVRVLLQNEIRIKLFEDDVGGHWPGVVSRVARTITEVTAKNVIDPVRSSLPPIVKHAGREEVRSALADQIDPAGISDTILANLRDFPNFLADRLKVQLRDQGKRHDLVDAVFALGDDDLVRIVARVEALDGFLKTEDGTNLLAGYKRAANILAAEEKKGKGLSDEDAQKPIDKSLLHEMQERALELALLDVAPKARACVAKEDFTGAMKALSMLRGPVDAFFEHVLVNAEEPALRTNRLRLLAHFRAALGEVADFSKVEG